MAMNTERIIQAMGESYSRSFQIAIARGEATGTASNYFLPLYCQHSYVDIELESVGRIGLLCEICDDTLFYQAWIEHGEGQPKGKPGILLIMEKIVEKGLRVSSNVPLSAMLSRFPFLRRIYNASMRPPQKSELERHKRKEFQR